MFKCKVCLEKDKRINDLQKQIDRLWPSNSKEQTKAQEEINLIYDNPSPPLDNEYKEELFPELNAKIEDDEKERIKDEKNFILNGDF